eukprot:403341901
MLTIIDLLALIAHAASCILIKRARDDTMKLGENLFDTVKKYEVNIYEVDWDLVQVLVYASLDLMLAIAALLVTIVFLPRLIMYVAIRVKKTQYSRRQVAYRVRLVTLVLHILLCLACIIGLIVCMVKTQKLTSFIAIPGVVVYSLLLGWILSFDIYYCCVYKRYYEKSKKKLPLEDKVQKYSAADQSIDYLQQQKAIPGHASKHSISSTQTIEGDNGFHTQKTLNQKTKSSTNSGTLSTSKSILTISQDQHSSIKNDTYDDQWNIPPKYQQNQRDIYQQSPFKQANKPSYNQQNQVNYDFEKQAKEEQNSPVQKRRRRRKQ